MNRLKFITGMLAVVSTFSVSSSFAMPAPCMPLRVYLETSPDVAGGGSVKNGSPVKMLSLMLKAGCPAGVTIRSITFVHEGSGDTKDISGVYVRLNGKVISGTSVIDPVSQTVTVRFTPAFVITGNTMPEIEVMADFSKAGAGTHSLMVEFGTDIIVEGTGELEGSFPMRGASFQIGGWNFMMCYRQALALPTAFARHDARRACRDVRRDQGGKNYGV